jgi:uncharacterized protein (DUF1697 family)
MATHIALLRAVNVGGTKKIAMADLRAFVAALGLGDAQTVLQSGNLVFTSDAKAVELERLLEREAEKRLDLATDFLVRTVKDWKSMIARNPFPEEARRDPAHVVAMLLKRAPSAAALKALEEAIAGPEYVHAAGNTLYAVYPFGIGESRLTNRLIESRLATRGTARNWNTVLKLTTLAGI